MIKSSGRLIRPQTTVFHTKELVTQTSVVFTRCVLVVKTKDHIELNDLHKKTFTVTLNVIQSLGTTQDLINNNKNKKKHLWKSTGMAINKTSHSYSQGQKQQWRDKRRQKQKGKKKRKKFLREDSKSRVTRTESHERSDPFLLRGSRPASHPVYLTGEQR